MSDTMQTVVEILNREVRYDPKALLIALGKAAVDTVTANWSGLAKSSLGVLSALGLKLPAGPERAHARAVALVATALNKGIVALVKDHGHMFGYLPFDRDVQTAGPELDVDVDDIAITFELDTDLFGKPESAPWVEMLHPAITAWFVTRGINGATARSIAVRLGHYYAAALAAEWRKNGDAYVEVVEFLNSEATPIDQRQRDWSHVRRTLMMGPNAPLFADGFSLEQVYQPLRAWHAEADEADEDDDCEDDDRQSRGRAAHRPKRRVVVDALGALGGWLKQDDPRDGLRVISGGPGAGKSSLARMIAAHRASEGDRVLLIELHRFTLADQLEAAVNRFGRHRGLHHDALDHLSADPLLIIFDGLDELSIRGSAGEGAVRELVQNARDLLSDFNRERLRVRVIMLGRQVVVQSLGNRFRRPGQLLTLLPYHVPDDQRARYHDPQKRLQVDQRDGWWVAYGRSVGRPYDGCPSVLDKVSALTAEPLLNYLVALTLERGKVDFSDANTSLTDVYDSLVRQVFDRVHAGPAVERPDPDQRLSGLEAVEFEDFQTFLQTVAVVAWHGEGRTAAMSDISAQIDDDLLDKMGLLEAGAQDAISRLIAAFYFRRPADAHAGARTFEFTHQSFAEYLIAGAILRFLDDLADEAARNKKQSRKGWSTDTQLIEWARRFGPSAIEPNVVAFLEDGLKRLHGAKDSPVPGYATLLSGLVSVVLADDFPVDGLPRSSHLSVALAASRNAGEALLALTSACAVVIAEVVPIAEPAAGAFGTWLRRLQPQRVGSEGALAVQSLRGLGLNAFNLAFQDLHRADLRGADLRRADLQGAHLQGADLRRADLERAYLQGADLRGADLRRAHLQGADLERAYLQGADLEGAHLRRAHLEGADLQGAHLRGADLQGADLRRADLRGADLQGAHLRGADLHWADLRGAHLEGADLRGAHLEGAHLRGADLEGAHLAWARADRRTTWPDGFDPDRYGVDYASTE